MWAADILAIAGGVLELTGLVLVVSEIRDARRQTKELGTIGERHVQIGPAYDKISTSEAGGTLPPLEERVTRLEERVNTLAEATRGVDKLVSEQLTVAVNKVYDVEYKRDKRLREFLAAQLQGGVGKRSVGVVLFALGVVCSVLANLL
jgi:hypothetical protein